jgi:hypothetical protein
VNPSAHATLVERISESPASKMAIVLHLNSFPHAVPSSICFKSMSAVCGPSKVCEARLLRRAGPPEHSKLRLVVGRDTYGGGEVYTDIVAGEVMNARLGKHSVVLEFGLLEGWSVARDLNDYQSPKDVA